MRKRSRVILDVSEFNRILDKAKSLTNVQFCSPEELNRASISLSTHSFIADRMVWIELTTKWYENKPTTYMFRKDGREDIVMSGADAYQALQSYYKLPSFDKDETIKGHLGMSDKGSFLCSSSPLLYYDEKFDKTEHEVYIYDLNSAYGFHMMSDNFPDTSHYELFTHLKEGQVGFMFDEQLTMVTKPGMFCDIAFDTMVSPYKEWVMKTYKKKSEGRTELERIRAKNLLNLPIGYQQRKNPFIRAFIVQNCNRYIRSLMDENTCMCNTDAIYSIVPRPDLDIGKDIGQWKLEYHGNFRQVGFNYQKVDTHETAVRGTPKTWFGDDFNILTDKIPLRGNKYKLNRDTLKVEEEVICYEV